MPLRPAKAECPLCLDSATLTSRMALAACITVVLMLAIFIVLGGQDPLQYVHSSSEYCAILLENMHFLSMIATALMGQEISLGEINLQVWESLVKFHISDLALFLLSFALRWVQLPIGLLIYLVPRHRAQPG